MVKLDPNDVTNAICPWSGSPVSPDSLVLYRDRVVGFCTPACRDKFEAALISFDAAINSAEESGK